MATLSLLKYGAVTVLAACSSVSSAENKLSWELNLETGVVWQSRNNVRIPGDDGTRFSLVDVAGKGPYSFYRLESLVNLDANQQLRFLIAPFKYTENGELDKDVFFVDQNFLAGQPTRATYKFNSYRISYRYRVQNSAPWQWWLGGTAKIRDAKVAISQGNNQARDTNVGFVPLVNLYGKYQMNPFWKMVLDLDGLVGPQGRAIDLGIKFHYQLNRQWYLGAGYRTLEGGVDNDSVYNFAWFNYALLTVGYQN